MTIRNKHIKAMMKQDLHDVPLSEVLELADYIVGYLWSIDRLGVADFRGEQTDCISLSVHTSEGCWVNGKTLEIALGHPNEVA